ncbi:MAG: GNAT family N-acetyltransferase [Chloroflexota bacterium]
MNDPTVEHLLDAVRDVFRRHIRRILVRLDYPFPGHSGVQADGWDQRAVQPAPTCRTCWRGSFAPSTPVWSIQVEPAVAPAPGPTLLAPLDPQRPADLLPLFSTVLTNPTLDFPPAGRSRGRFLLRGVEASAPERMGSGAKRPSGWLRVVGSDNAEMLRRSGIGRRLVWRTWLALRDAALSGTSDHTGRLFFGGVIPEWQGRGVGQQLWQAALQITLERGWTGLTIGPVWTENGRAFLANQGNSHTNGASP